MSIKSYISGNLFHYRQEHKLTQKEMAEICDMSLRHYQDLEIGRSLPSLANAVFIAKTLDFSLEEMKSEVTNDELPVSDL